MSNSVRPHRWQPTRLLCPWDSPGKNTGVGCHFLLQCMKVKSESEVAQSCLTLSDPMDCSLPGSSVHGIFQARVLEWGGTVNTYPFSLLGSPLVSPLTADAGPLSRCLQLLEISRRGPFLFHPPATLRAKSISCYHPFASASAILGDPVGSLIVFPLLTLPFPLSHCFF